MRVAFITLSLAAFAIAKPLQALAPAEKGLSKSSDEVALNKAVDAMVEQAWQDDVADYDTSDFADKKKHKHKHLRKLIRSLIKAQVAKEVALAVNSALAKLKAAGAFTVPLSSITLEVPNTTTVITKEVMVDESVPEATVTVASAQGTPTAALNSLSASLAVASATAAALPAAKSA
ncbi:hypothetical protein ONZ45_g11902 [Pleurotus djamor]|nr:hypothetical protein ONZ45_g11902 [Pleurotus djamor]